MNKRKMYVVSQHVYYEPFRALFELVPYMDKADVVMFTGGEDVSPSLYGENKGSYTSSNPFRDQEEVIKFKDALKLKKKMIGICRGAQFLTVMAGGKLVQDVACHAVRDGHQILTETGNTVVISSTHHQMMHPFDLDSSDYRMIAWADGLSGWYLDGNDDTIPHSGIEPEIVWYPKIQALCIQGHPEIMDENSPGVKYCQQLAKEYLYD